MQPKFEGRKSSWAGVNWLLHTPKHSVPKSTYSRHSFTGIPGTPSRPSSADSSFTDPSNTPSTSATTTLTKRPRNAKWSHEEIKSLLHQLQQAKADGNTSDTTYKASTFQAIADSFSDPAKTRRSCETKFQRLKKEYKEVTLLSESPGFNWDERHFFITATPAVWDELERVSCS